MSRLLTSFWFEPYLLHKRIFGCSSAPYFLRQGLYLAVVAVSFAFIQGTAGTLRLGLWGDFLLKGILCVIVPNGLLLLLSGRTEAFGYLKRKLLEKQRDR